MKAPDLWIVAGPNGSGKSTLIRRVLDGKLPVVNTDDLAAAISLERRNTPAVQLAAGRQALIARASHLAAKEGFVVETTLSGHVELRLMSEAKQAGYRVNLLFVGLDDAELSKGRVAYRVQAGGHSVTDSDITRRYPTSLANLAKALPLADRAWVLDNSGEQRRLLLARRGHQVRRVASQLPAWAQAAIPKEMRKAPRVRDLGL